MMSGGRSTRHNPEMIGREITACSQGTSFLSNEVVEGMFNIEMLSKPQDDTNALKCPSITMDNSLSPSHTLVQIVCQDHRDLLYDVMRTLKDYNIQHIRSNLNMI